MQYNKGNRYCKRKLARKKADQEASGNTKVSFATKFCQKRI